MKIATFNINNVRRRLPSLLRWLEESAPDVVCLQELKTLDEAFPVAEIERAGYGAVWKGQKSWNGVAILAKNAEPVVTRRALPGNAEDTHARYIEAAVEGILIASIYLPNGNPQPGPKFDYKLAWFERLIAHAAELWDSGLPVILAGDFNIVPTDFDIYRVRSYADNALLQPAPREAFVRLLSQGWVDAVRKLHPDAPMYSFWDYMFQRWERDYGLRLDFLLLSKPVAKRLKAAGVDRFARGFDDASDHAPVWAELAPAKA